MNQDFECPRCGHCCQAEVNKEAMKLALEALESDPISHAGLVSRKQAITAMRQALEKQWVGLTDEEVSDVIDNVLEGGGWLDVSRALEAKLKEKNHG